MTMIHVHKQNFAERSYLDRLQMLSEIYAANECLGSELAEVDRYQLIALMHHPRPKHHNDSNWTVTNYLVTNIKTAH